MRLRCAQGELAVEGPRPFLRALYEQCDGRTRIADLRPRRSGRADATRFIAFVRDMWAAGVLVDAENAFARTFDEVQRRVGQEDVGEGAGPATTAPPSFGNRPLRETELVEVLDAMLRGPASDSHRPMAARDGREIAASAKILQLSLVLWREVGTLAPGVFAVHPGGDGGAVLRRVADASSAWCTALQQPHWWAPASGWIALGSELASTGRQAPNSLQVSLVEAGAALQRARDAATGTDIALHSPVVYRAEQLVTLSCLTGSRVLCCAVVGPKPAADLNPARRRPVRFRWMDMSPGGSSHVARAEVDLAADRTAIGWGRSHDPLQAATCAIAEASERCSFHRLGAHAVEARADELERVVAPRSLAPYADGQYRSGRLGVQRFDRSRRYLWVPATGLRSGERTWVPAEFVHPLAALPEPYASRALTRACSSGCAADVSAAVAIERAAFEVIERDALARHWLTQTPGSAVRPAAGDSALRERIDRLRRADCGVALQVLDAGLGPVALVVVSSREHGFSAVGTACGPDAAEAFERALGEAETIAHTRLAGVRPRPTRARDAATSRDHLELHSMRIHAHRAWALIGAGAAEPLDALAGRWPSSVTARLDRRPMRGEPLWVDLADEDAPAAFDGRPLVTVRALVPGCLPLAFGFDAIPRGGIAGVTGAGRFPHPLA